MTLAPSAIAMRATSRPIAPQPTTPIVRPRTSMPRTRGQPPDLMPASASGMDRMALKIRPMVSSATPSELAPSAIMICTPRWLRVSIGRLSTPTPLRLITFSFSATAMILGVTGSTPASQPTQSGTSVISSCSVGMAPAVE